MRVERHQRKIRILPGVKMRLCCWIGRGYCANGAAGLRRSMWRCGLLKSIESQSAHFGRIENRLDFTASLIGTEANCKKPEKAITRWPPGTGGDFLRRS